MSSLPIFDATVPVLVFKIGRYPIHHGTLGIIRSLGKIGLQVYAIIDDHFAPAATSRYLAGAFKWHTGDMDAGKLLAGMASIGRRLGGRAILIPTDDLAATFIAEHAEPLSAWFRFPRLPTGLPRRLTNKKDLYYLCRQAGVPCPECSFPRSIDEVCEFSKQATFPVVIKAAEQSRLPRGARATHIARNPAELMSMYNRLEDLRKPNLLFQEYIPECSAEDWIFHGYANPESECFLGFTGRKLRSWPPFAGLTTLGVSVANESLRLQTLKLIKSIGFAGIMDLDYRLDKRDGQYKLLDFNPRIGANFRMFEDVIGLDVVRAVHLDLTGKRICASQDMKRRTFIVESFDLFAALAYMRRGGLTFTAWRHSLGTGSEFAWFDLRDPVPFLTMWAWFGAQTAEHALQRCLAWIRRERHSNRTGSGILCDARSEQSVRARISGAIH